MIQVLGACAPASMRHRVGDVVEQLRTCCTQEGLSDLAGGCYIRGKLMMFLRVFNLDDWRMVLKLRILLPSFLLCFAVVALAADFAGEWKAEVHAKNETVIPFALDLKVDGSTLTGTLQYATRKPRALENGVIKGDEATFTVNEISEAGPYKMSYKAKLRGR